MKIALRLLPLMMASVFSISAQAWIPPVAGSTPTTPASSGGAGELDGIKGTVGIVCVGNDGSKITWYPAAANSSLVAASLKRCFEEVAMNWDGVSPPAGSASGAPRDIPTPIEAFMGLMGVMDEVERVAP